jgi:SPP1 family predicted phage head-tail adaptor
MSFASHLETELTIQKPTMAQTGLKSTTRTWADATAYGMIEQLSGDELVMMGRLGKNATHRLYLDHEESIDIGYRVIADSVTYEVEAVAAAAGITKQHHSESLLIKRS